MRAAFRALQTARKDIAVSAPVYSNWIHPNMTTIHQAGTADGWHGEIKQGGPFEPEAGRYHLYIGRFIPRDQDSSF
jgi:hypothetical protein